MRRRWTIALRVLPLCLLAAVLWREKPWTVRLSANAPWAIGAAIVINLVFSLPLKAWRWRLALVDPPPFRQVFAATIEGLLATTAIGFGSGDVVRAARLKRPQRTGPAQTDSLSDGGANRPKVPDPGVSQFAIDYGCTWAERGAEVLALAIMLFVAAVVTDLSPVAMVIAGLSVVGYLTVLATGRVLVPRLQRWPRVQRAMSAGLRASTPRRVALMAMLSLLGWSVELVMLVLFQRAFALPASASTALLTLVGINAAIAIPTVPGHFGTYEAGIATVLVLSGARRDVAVSYAVAFHLSHVVPVALAASAILLYSNRRRRLAPAVRSTLADVDADIVDDTTRVIARQERG